MITLFGVVDFLSYITSAGYLFVLFFSNLAMITLHKKHPSIHRPFRAPFFPLTPILASLTCVIVIFFSDLNALLFTGVVIAAFVAFYYVRTGVRLWQAAHKRSLSPGRWRIILPLTDPTEMDGLMKVGSAAGRGREGSEHVSANDLARFHTNVDLRIQTNTMTKIRAQRHAVLETFIHYAVDRNVPMYTKMITDVTMADGVINEIKNDDNVKLVLMRWPGQARGGDGYRKALKRLVEEAKVNLAVLNDRGINEFPRYPGSRRGWIEQPAGHPSGK